MPDPGSEGRLPTFLVVGVPKAGTTTLAAALAAHPDVFMSAEKELHFFDGSRLSEDWYRAQFADAAPDAVAVGEATPTYILNAKALDRMTELVPDARLIVIMRNPVDRAYSHYWWNRALKERRGFAEAVRSEMAAGPSSAPLSDPSGPVRYQGYTEGGRYLELLDRLHTRYAPEKVLPLVLEDLRTDPAHFYRTVFGFLGIDQTVVPPQGTASLNPAYRVRSERLRRAMFRFRAWKRLPFGLAGRIDRLNRAPLDYPPIDPDLRAELVAWFRPANDALSARLGRGLQAWNR
jgi:sulfotransferase family protein